MQTGSIEIMFPRVNKYDLSPENGLPQFPIYSASRAGTHTVTTNYDDIPVPYDSYRQTIVNEQLVSQSIAPLSYSKPIEGCTDPTALNYNPEAEVDNGSCIAPVLGCTDPAATNYDPLANVDNGTCTYPIWGCTDPAYIEFNPEATHDLPRGEGIFGACNITIVEQQAADELAAYQDSLALITADLKDQTIGLPAGIHLVSTYVAPPNGGDWLEILKNVYAPGVGQISQIDSVLSSYITRIEDQAGNFIDLQSYAGDFYSLPNWHSSGSYVFTVFQACELRLNGAAGIAPTTSSQYVFEETNFDIPVFPITLPAASGPNNIFDSITWIPYPLPFPKTPEQFLQLSKTGSYTEITQYGITYNRYNLDGIRRIESYDKKAWQPHMQANDTHTLRVMEPGQGYIIYNDASESIDLNIPMTSLSTLETNPSVVHEQIFKSATWHMFGIPRDIYNEDGLGIYENMSIPEILSHWMDLPLGDGTYTDRQLTPQEVVDNIDQIKDDGGASTPSGIITVADTFEGIPDGVESFTAGKGYQIKTKTENLRFRYSAPRYFKEFTHVIKEGWSFISMPHWYQTEPHLIFSSIADKIQVVKNSAGRSWTPASQPVSVFNFIPGEGYQIKMDEEVTIIYNILRPNQFEEGANQHEATVGADAETSGPSTGTYTTPGGY